LGHVDQTCRRRDAGPGGPGRAGGGGGTRHDGPVPGRVREAGPQGSVRGGGAPGHPHRPHPRPGREAGGRLLLGGREEGELAALTGPHGQQPGGRGPARGGRGDGDRRRHLQAEGQPGRRAPRLARGPRGEDLGHGRGARAGGHQLQVLLPLPAALGTGRGRGPRLRAGLPARLPLRRRGPGPLGPGLPARGSRLGGPSRRCRRPNRSPEGVPGFQSVDGALGACRRGAASPPGLPRDRISRAIPPARRAGPSSRACRPPSPRPAPCRAPPGTGTPRATPGASCRRAPRR
jgi:hypothetical protein